MTTKREKPIVDAILKYLNGLPHCYAEKNAGRLFGNATVDITGCVRGRRIDLEVKRPGAPVTRRSLRQGMTLQKWNKAGALTAIVTSVDEVRDLLNDRTFFTGER